MKNWLRTLIGQKLYWHVTLKMDKGKGGYVDEPEQVAHMLQYCGDIGEYDIQEIWLWKWQHTRLKEFEGF